MERQKGRTRGDAERGGGSSSLGAWEQGGECEGREEEGSTREPRVNEEEGSEQPVVKKGEGGREG
eukprot:3753815-Rhodomonas_salina.1